jgi:hypothetical protein
MVGQGSERRSVRAGEGGGKVGERVVQSGEPGSMGNMGVWEVWEWGVDWNPYGRVCNPAA